jgi:hypothetical protein
MTIVLFYYSLPDSSEKRCNAFHFWVICYNCNSYSGNIFTVPLCKKNPHRSPFNKFSSILINNYDIWKTHTSYNKRFHWSRLFRDILNQFLLRCWLWKLKLVREWTNQWFKKSCDLLIPRYDFVQRKNLVLSKGDFLIINNDQVNY